MQQTCKAMALSYLQFVRIRSCASKFDISFNGEFVCAFFFSFIFVHFHRSHVKTNEANAFSTETDFISASSVEFHL